MTSELARLRSTIDRADSAYYRTGESRLRDNEYDALKSRLRTLAPDDERLTRVGPPYAADEMGTKVKHRIPMGSLDNTDGGIDGLAAWWADMKAKLPHLSAAPAVMMSHKVDGSSVVLDYEDGRLVRAATRGNGEVGEDITANAVQFQFVPTVLPELLTCSVRGEAVLHRADFEFLMKDVPEDERSNPRNVGNGIIVRESGEQAQYITFVAFNLSLSMDEQEKFKQLEALGFIAVPHRRVRTLAQATAFYEETLATRGGLPYDVDGMVAVLDRADYQAKFITADPKTQLRPKYARAIKFPAYTATTTVTGVVVTVGHNRVVVPTLSVAPVRIGAGITVDSVLVTNYDEIDRHDVAVGDEVEIMLAGDIIPNLSRVLKRPPDRKPITRPEKCPACGAKTSRTSRGKEGANLYCTAKECSAAMIRKIGHWCGSSRKGIGILDLGDVMIQALWDAGLVKDPADLYTLTPDQLENVVMGSGVRIGRSRAETIVRNIQDKKRLPLHLFLGGLGIDLLGTRRVLLLAKAADGWLNLLEQWLDDGHLAALDIEGMNGDDSVTRKALREGIDACRPLIKKLLSVGVVALPIEDAKPQAAKGNGTVAGKTFVFTGTRSLIKETEAAGGIVKDGISKGLDYLVQKDPASVSNKTKKALEYGIKVIGLDQLQAALDGKAPLP